MSNVIKLDIKYKRSEIEEILKRWYEMNLEICEELPKKQKPWEPFFRKLTLMQYQALLMSIF